MTKKLTLRFDADVIDRAKAYAQTHGMSLSQMAEHYFDLLTKPTTPCAEELPPIVKRLSQSPPVEFKIEDLADDPRLEYIYNKHVR